jgi:hypothetical protein
MWEHQNQVCLNTVTPAKLQEIKTLNAEITKQVEDGTDGLGHKDSH